MRSGSDLVPGSPVALVHHRFEPVLLHRPAKPPHMAWRDAQNLGRLHPPLLLGDCLGIHFPPGHCPRLPPDLPLNVVYRTALSQLADMFKCLCPGHLQCL